MFGYQTFADIPTEYDQAPSFPETECEPITETHRPAYAPFQNFPEKAFKIGCGRNVFGTNPFAISYSYCLTAEMVERQAFVGDNMLHDCIRDIIYLFSRCYDFQKEVFFFRSFQLIAPPS